METEKRDGTPLGAKFCRAAEGRRIMALWDDITKSAKDAAQFTVKKTEELTNVAKLKFAIHTEETSLDKCYSEIGSYYYAFQRKAEEHTADIAALLIEADERNSKLNCLRESLAKLQKSVICPSCGAQITTEFDFCPLCGKKLKKEAEEKNDTEE